MFIYVSSLVGPFLWSGLQSSVIVAFPGHTQSLNCYFISILTIHVLNTSSLDIMHIASLDYAIPSFDFRNHVRILNVVPDWVQLCRFFFVF